MNQPRYCPTVRNCPDCGVAAGAIHQDGCDVERCSGCGLQRIGCEIHLHRGHDRAFARWSGWWPGELESQALGIDLNEFHIQNWHKILFVKPR